MISIKNISKSFQGGSSKQVVLDNLDLSIAKGEIVILLGKSGSGKSTLLNILSGIDIPDLGTVSINSEEITSLSENNRTLLRRHKIGFIFQFFNLVPTLTVEENLLLPLELNDLTNKDELVKSILNEVELTDKLVSYPDKLSGGERQRVAIARALIHNPDIILADEPTGNLDYETSVKIIDLLDRVVKKKSKTMIMVTHSKDVIGLADRILTIRNGKVTEIKKEDAFA
jgi:putative ABC transport system ATP-binding protein